MRCVIIGNSAAGISAAETIRSLDPRSSVTIISGEDCPPYSRCLLPNFLAGDIKEDRLRIRSRDFYARNRIKVRLGKKAAALDTGNKRVVLEDNQTVEYDKLLIATGSVTAYPPLEGINLPGVFGLRTMEDAKKILEAAGPSRRAVVVGAGLVGLEVAYALYRRGLEVTVVEKAPRIVPQLFDSTAAEVLERDMEAEGIRLVLGTGIQGIMGPPLWERFFGRKGKGVILENGSRLKCELVVVATGALPNIEIVKNTGIRVNRGIVVNDLMQTSEPDIFAAGDVAETLDIATGLRGVAPIWPNAVVQGRFAGYNMVGRRRIYNGLIGMQNAVEFREVPAIAVGFTQADPGEYEVLTVYRPQQNVYKKLVIKDNILKGMILTGDIASAGVLSALIRKKADIAGIKHRLLQDDFGYGDFLHRAVVN